MILAIATRTLRHMMEEKSSDSTAKDSGPCATVGVDGWFVRSQRGIHKMRLHSNGLLIFAPGEFRA